MRKCLTAIIVLATIVSSVNAYTRTYFVDEGMTDTGHRSWLMWIDVEAVPPDNSWTNGRIEVPLTSGSFYYWTPPEGPRPTPPGWDPPATSVWSPCGGEPAIAEWIAGGESFVASWGTITSCGPGLYTVGRLVFTPDACGTIWGKMYDTSNPGVGCIFDEYWIEDGVIVPEPATIALMALGPCLALLRKRR